MKRIVTLALSLILVVMAISALAEASDEELRKQLDTIRNELTARGLKAENKTVLLDEDGYRIYINDDMILEKRYDWDEAPTLFVPVVIVNDTDKNIGVMINYTSVNGWTAYGSTFSADTPAGKKTKGSFIFDLKDADIDSLDDFTDAEFTILIYDEETYNYTLTSSPITIYANK